jgi:hypothetical protein
MGCDQPRSPTYLALPLRTIQFICRWHIKGENEEEKIKEKYKKVGRK